MIWFHVLGLNVNGLTNQDIKKLQTFHIQCKRSRLPIGYQFFRYGDERALDKPEVNNNSDKMAICGRKMPILKRYCNVLIRNVNF